MMNQQRVQVVFFLVLLGLAAVMTYFVYQPFLNVIILALVLAILLHRIYERLLKLFGGRSRTAASVIIVLAIIFILTPLFRAVPFKYSINREISIYSCRTDKWITYNKQ